MKLEEAMKKDWVSEVALIKCLQDEDLGVLTQEKVSWLIKQGVPATQIPKLFRCDPNEVLPFLEKKKQSPKVVFGRTQEEKPFTPDEEASKPLGGEPEKKLSLRQLYEKHVGGKETGNVKMLAALFEAGIDEETIKKAVGDKKKYNSWKFLAKKTEPVKKITKPAETPQKHKTSQEEIDELMAIYLNATVPSLKKRLLAMLADMLKEV